MKLFASVTAPPVPRPLAHGLDRTGSRDWRASATRVLVSPWLIAFLLVAGVALRVGRFLTDRALWLDESYLALNLMNRSYSELLGLLDFGQGAPPGFLLAQKLVVNTLGDGEHALRLLPLLAGVASLFVFYAVARRLLSPLAVPFALLLFALGKPFIVYSAELKQYGFDVLVVLIVFWVLLRTLDRETFRVGDALVLAAVGAAAVWFSHPAVFVLAGVGAGLAVALLRRAAREVALLAIPFATWLLSFFALYALTLREIGHIEAGTQEAAGALGSPAQNLYHMLNQLEVVDWAAAGIGPLFAAVGLVALWAVRRNRPLLVAGAVMAAAAVAAGYVGKYPVGQRFILFLLPPAILVFAEGVVRLVRVLPRNLAVPVALVLALAVVVPPVKRAAEGEVVKPPEHEEIRPVLAYIGANWQSGDTLYVTGPAQYALRYYLECSGCADAVPPRLRTVLRVRPQRGRVQLAPALVSETPHVVIGRQKRRLFAQDVEQLRGRDRVWALFTHRPRSRNELLEPITRLGRERQCSPVSGVAFACLYDFTPYEPFRGRRF